MIIIQVLLILWIVISIKRKPEICFWNKQEIKAIRGMMAVIIVIFHSSVYAKGIPLFLKGIDNFIAIIIVALFSFFSSYGIEKSIIEKGNQYLKKLYKRIIYILFYEIVIFITKVILGIVTLTAGIMWINTLLLFYMSSYIFHKFFGEKAYIGILFFWIIFSVIDWIFPTVIFQWPHQSLLFGIGALYYHYQNKIISFVQNLKALVFFIVCSLLVSIIIGYLYFFKGSYPNISAMMQMERCFLTVFLSCIIIMIGHFVILKNHIMNYLGNLSLSIYMIHGVVMDFLSARFKPGEWIIITTLLLTIIVAFCINVLMKYMRYVINRIKLNV